MYKRLAWEKNWLKSHGWSVEEILELENNDIKTPVEYLTNAAIFRNLTLKVNESTLIPRKETEKIVDWAETWCRENQCFFDFDQKKSSYQVIEIGTGSGAISLALAWQFKNIGFNKMRILATEVSDKALIIARENCQKYNLEKMITFQKSNLLSMIKNILNNQNNPYILLANLPYIPSDEVIKLNEEVKDYEPVLALDGGVDGFILIGKLLSQVEALKIKPALIILEIDPSHEKMFVNNSYRWKIMKDENYYPRYAIGILKKINNLVV